ncbi:unnamed protein product [Rhizophagus irregularis]|uniref:Uncharacterized protein n=1 Tax=Rhizophagus irregularis TaxID=588596 RepID=A0A2I1GD66_9GLOM|nr:hypothetical protein RhiirA4_458906 [Rhizophagus irregularis]CAB4421135.1 unnamed protein product [Rhizophagus irregularis]
MVSPLLNLWSSVVPSRAKPAVAQMLCAATQYLDVYFITIDLPFSSIGIGKHKEKIDDPPGAEPCALLKKAHDRYWLDVLREFFSLSDDDEVTDEALA